MILLEFAAQGIRGVAPPTGRVTLKPGYNVVAADGAALRRLLEALLCPDPRDGEAMPRPQGPGAGALRAGMTLVGDDKVTYRLVRDFTAGAQLHRFDPVKRAFALVSQDLAEIAAFLQKGPGVPPPDRLGALLSLNAADLPSRSSGGGVGGAGAAQALAPQRAALTPEQARKRLAQLRDELGKAKVAEKLQADLDELQSRTFKLDEVLRVGTEIKEGLKRAEGARAELDPIAQVAEAMGDPAARIAAFEKATARRDEALARAAAELESLDEIEAGGTPGPLWREPQLWAGVGAAAVLVGLGAVGVAMDSGLRYVMLLDVFALGWAALASLRWVSGLERWERTGRRRRVVDDWQQKVEAQYERDAAEVRRALKAANVSKVADLGEAFGRVGDADRVVSDWRQRLADWEADPDAAGARAERSRVDEQLKAIETRLAREAGGGFVRDVRSIEMEIQRLEAEAAAPPVAAAPAPAPAPARAPAPAAEPLRALLEKAAAVLGGSPSGAARAVGQKASQALVGLSFQRYSAIQVDDRGGLHAVIGGRTTPAMTLPPADRDLVFLALKLAFMEHVLQGARRVAIVEDVFGGLSDGARRFAARLIKQLARNGQVVHGTSDAAFREAADHSA